LTDLVKDAEAADRPARLRSLRDLDGAALLLREMGLLVLADDALPLDQWRDTLFERFPRSAVEAAMGKVVEAIAQPRDAKPYTQLRAQWTRARRLFFNIATRIETDAAPGGQAVKAAIAWLEAAPDWAAPKMRDAPIAVVSRGWRHHVLGGDG
jgi:hypothetical protein